MEGADAMTAEALRAEIAATRQRRLAAEARHSVLAAESAEAEERHRLRAELELERAELAAQELENRHEEGWRRAVDADTLNAGNSVLPVLPRVRWPSCNTVPAQANGGQSSSFGHAIVRGEYVWELRQFSWLQSALKQRLARRARSEEFQVGAYEFWFVYSPAGGILPESHSRGTLAICTAETSRILLRYRICVKGPGGDFVQFGETCDEFHHGAPDRSLAAYGPDVQPRDSNTRAKGIFGLTYKQLLQSQWVTNDTLTVKFTLEVRPCGLEEFKPLKASAEVPGPTLQCDTEALLQNAACSDLRLVVRDEVIPAHSQILCARSEVFRHQLAAGMQESITKQIVIEDCDAATFRAFLKFLYTDSLPSAEDLEDLMHKASDGDESHDDGQVPLAPMLALLAVSHKYQVMRLQRWCEQQLCERLSTPQLCGILQQAHLLQAEQLEKACLCYLRDHMQEVAKLPAYDELFKAWPQIGQKISFFMVGMAPIQAKEAPHCKGKRRRKRKRGGTGA